MQPQQQAELSLQAGRVTPAGELTAAGKVTAAAGGAVRRAAAGQLTVAAGEVLWQHAGGEQQETLQRQEKLLVAAGELQQQEKFLQPYRWVCCCSALCTEYWRPLICALRTSVKCACATPWLFVLFLLSIMLQGVVNCGCIMYATSSTSYMHACCRLSSVGAS
jgi:hypothetical protein